MTYEPLNRRLAILAAAFAFLGVILGVIALATNYWTIGINQNRVYNETGFVNAAPVAVQRWNVCTRLFYELIFYFLSRVSFKHAKMMFHARIISGQQHSSFVSWAFSSSWLVEFSRLSIFPKRVIVDLLHLYYYLLLVY